MKRTIRLGFIGWLTILSTVAFSSGMKVANVKAYWKDKGSLTVTNIGPCARLTPQASTWLKSFYKLVQPTGKIVPTKDPVSSDPVIAGWQAWVQRQIAIDQAEAQQAAANGTAYVPSRRTAPAELVGRLGDPPPFANVFTAKRYAVEFHDKTSIQYQDCVRLRPSYAYFRFTEGVNFGGTKVRQMPPRSVSTLFNAAGLNSKAVSVFKAVSLLEGGFDSVNTYDTGWVSVGFIQFACLSEGSGSLGALMQTMKARYPSAFANEFERFGVGVDGSGRLQAVDIERGVVVTGQAAALQIIGDKRLTAVFQRAGQKVKEYRVAQLICAKEKFYPVNDRFTVRLNGQPVSVRVGDVFTSEAGLATLMDRKVNTGKLDGLSQVVQMGIDEYQLTTLEELAALEVMFTQAMVYRHDYLADASLGQPSGFEVATSRSGKRTVRKK